MHRQCSNEMDMDFYEHTLETRVALQRRKYKSFIKPASISKPLSSRIFKKRKNLIINEGVTCIGWSQNLKDRHEKWEKAFHVQPTFIIQLLIRQILCLKQYSLLFCLANFILGSSYLAKSQIP